MLNGIQTLSPGWMIWLGSWRMAGWTKRGFQEGLRGEQRGGNESAESNGQTSFALANGGLSPGSGLQNMNYLD